MKMSKLKKKIIINVKHTLELKRNKKIIIIILIDYKRKTFNSFFL
jgi:hypothetical protein